jgi:hypothetical protein
MKPRTVLVINAIVDALFGAPLLVTPALMLPRFGIEPNRAALLLARDVGVSLLALAMLDWLGRDATGVALRAVLWANVFLQGAEAAMNLFEVGLGVAPAGVLPGELVRVVLVVLLWLALRHPAARGRLAEEC